MLDKIAKALQKYPYADALVQKSSYSSISLKDGNIEQLNEGTEESICCRVLLNNSFGFASSNSISDFEEILKRAEKLAKIRSNITSSEKFGKPEIHKAKLSSKPGKNPKNFSWEDKIGMLKGWEKIARSRKRVFSAQLSLYDSFTERTFLSSEGSDISEPETRTGANITAFAKQNGRIESWFGQEKKREGMEVVDNFEKVAENVSQSAIMMLSAKHGPKGKMRVILDPELAGVLAHEAIGHACEADGVLADNSALSGKMGMKIAGETVNILDDPAFEKSLWGSYVFDDEGTKAKGVCAVKNGKLNSFLTSLETSSAMNGFLSGSARSDGDSPQIVRMSNTFFAKGDSEKEELFEGVNGIYLVGVKEGQVSPKSGSFTFAARCGHVLKNGEKKQLLKDCSISGNILSSLNGIDLIAKDLEFCPGTCGKEGQGVPVTTGSPHLRMNDILVG